MRLAYPLCSLSVALVAAACSDDGAGPLPPPPLEIVTTSPSADAADVETGATVAVVFSQAIDPATVTPQTFMVKRGDDPLTTTLSYDASTRTARVSAPFLPGAAYNVEVTTGVRTPGGTALGAAHSWSFTTRSWQAITLDAGDMVGTTSSLALDADGQVHVTYHDFINGDLKYAVCSAGCAALGNWQAIVVDASPGAVGEYSSLLVESGGRLHVSYYSAGAGDLKYATCASDCGVPASWVSTFAETTDFAGFYTSLARDADGRLHVSYFESLHGDLGYATCASLCTDPASWQSDIVDYSATGETGSTNSSLAVDAEGRLHVMYYESSGTNLKYATCPSACETYENWEAIVVGAGVLGQYPSLELDPSGRLHVSYFRSDADLGYATCPAACELPESWQHLTVDDLGGAYTSLALDASGRLHVSYYDNTSFDLEYATCAAACELAASWQRTTIDAEGDVGRTTSLAVGTNGRIHVSYYDWTNRDLKYVE
jgi:hypothetical protein